MVHCTIKPTITTVSNSSILAYRTVPTTSKSVTKKPNPADETRMSDWTIRLRASDHRAFEEVFQTFYDPLLGYALYLLKDRSIALDVVQEAFMKLWERRDTLNPNKSMKSLLYMIVRNLSLNHHRDTTSREAKLKDAGDDIAMHKPSAPDDAFAGSALKDQLDKWIESLPERQREALVLSRFQGLNHQEVAAVMDVSPRTVNNHLVRALKFIHGKIKGYEPSLLEL